MKKRLIFSLFGFFALLFASLVFFYKSHNGKKRWMSEQIQNDLSLYSSEDLSPASLQSYFASSNNSQFLVYYQIKDGKLYFKKNWESQESLDRFKKTTRLLNRVAQKNKLPDMEWILTVHDGLRHNSQAKEQNKIPLFCYAKTEGKEGILIPDPLTEDFARVGRKSIWRSTFRPKYQWKNKKNIAFWRGGTTGDAKAGSRPYDENTWFKQPRTHLSLLSEYHPDQVDAGFTSFPGVEPKVRHQMHQHIKPLNWITHKDHLLYKYLVIPDGNTCTYPRYYLALYSNSVAFKQQSDQIQWFYKPLQAGVHFIEVANDFSDLPEIVSWAKNNDSSLKKIAKRGHRWIRQNLMPRHIDTFTQELLLEYAKKQGSKTHLLEGVMTYEELKRN